MKRHERDLAPSLLLEPLNEEGGHADLIGDPAARAHQGGEFVERFEGSREASDHGAQSVQVADRIGFERSMAFRASQRRYRLISSLPERGVTIATGSNSSMKVAGSP
jgi:hypothetical protein